MNTGGEGSQLDERVACLAVLVIYAKSDIAVCGRVLQVLTVRQVVVERFVADFSRFDHREIKGLSSIASPVMRMSLAVSLPNDHGMERLTKLLNRIVGIYKVESPYCV